MPSNDAPSRLDGKGSGAEKAFMARCYDRIERVFRFTPGNISYMKRTIGIDNMRLVRENLHALRVAKFILCLYIIAYRDESVFLELWNELGELIMNSMKHDGKEGNDDGQQA